MWYNFILNPFLHTLYVLSYFFLVILLIFLLLSGLLTRAVKEGHWILLDEVNMANPETLECLSSLLDLDGSVCLYEKVNHSLLS